jgi:hypothetical protein
MDSQVPVGGPLRRGRSMPPRHRHVELRRGLSPEPTVGHHGGAATARGGCLHRLLSSTPSCDCPLPELLRASKEPRSMRSPASASPAAPEYVIPAAAFLVAGLTTAASPVRWPLPSRSISRPAPPSGRSTAATNRVCRRPRDKAPGGRRPRGCRDIQRARRPAEDV